MPWTHRPRRSPLSRIRGDLRRWRYDHSEHIVAAGIGSTVVGVTVVLLVAMKLAG